ncbi:hypothetical protein WSM22_29400 [Cytophagales bacterium WSM2-2]|nr:hypothetical protein WSM22_29400 [Cytophagales bacterium WSM2-2]
MRVIAVMLFLISTVVLGQSKKELEAKVKALEAESSALKAETSALKAALEELKKSKSVELTAAEKKVGYGLGVLMASNIRGQGADSIDVEAMIAGIRDVYTNQKPKMDQQQCMEVVQPFMIAASEKRVAKAKGPNLAFLESNKKNPGVVVTASGLQYKVINKGTGKSPKLTDQVTVRYAGSLIDGTPFDSSKGETVTFAVNRLVQGWTEALQIMREGDKWTLYIPSELAYGERGMGGAIPPYATLVFELELVKVN